MFLDDTNINRHFFVLLIMKVLYKILWFLFEAIIIRGLY